MEATHGLNGSYFAEHLCLCHRNRPGFMSLHVHLLVEAVPRETELLAQTPVRRQRHRLPARAISVVEDAGAVNHDMGCRTQCDSSRRGMRDFASQHAVTIAEFLQMVPI
jgi:hypothetical protein